MPHKTQQTLEDEQAQRFRQAARQLDTDDDEARFAERLKKVAKAKPKDEKPVTSE